MIKNRHRMLKINSIIIFVTIPILIVIGLLSFYSYNVKNCEIVISDKSDIALALSKTEDGSDNTSNLQFAGMTNMDLITYDDIPDDIKNCVELGDNSDYYHRRYLSYTFYLRNLGVTTNYNMTFNIESETKGVSSAIRVMIDVDGNQKFYAKGTDKEPIGSTETTPDSLVGKIENFLSPKKICEYENVNIKEKTNQRYTILIWLEGEDPECIDYIKGGSIYFSMDFNALDNKKTVEE